MGLSFQYNLSDGSFRACIGADKPIPAENFPEGVGQYFVEKPDAGVQYPAMRFNDVMRCLVPCPKYARDVARGEIFGQLREIDAKRLRAITDVLLTGDKTALQALEDKASDLRKQLAAIP